MNPFEWQLLMATAYVLPVVVILIVAFLSGVFSRAEEARGLPLLGRDRWDEAGAGETGERRE